MVVNDALRQVYKDYYPTIRTLVLSNSGQEENAADIFQEAIIIMMRQLRHGKFKRQSNLKGFVYGISRNIWLKELRKKSVKTISLNEVPGIINDIEPVYQGELGSGRLNKVGDFVKQLDQGCQDILEAFYYQKKSVKEIMQIFGVANEAAVKNRKYRCMKKLIKLIESKKLNRSSFEES